MSWSRHFAPKAEKQGRTRGQQRVDFHGRSFGSKLEAAVYGLLLLRQKAGEILEIECQRRVQMHSLALGESWGCIPDFRCTLPTGLLYVEAKGFEQDRWLGTRFIWSLCGPAPLEVWKGRYERPHLHEIITPAQDPNRGR